MPRRKLSLPAILACAVALTVAGTAAADVWLNSGPYAGTKRYYQVLTAKHSGLNLNVPEASTKNGTQIIQWKQPGAMNEQWEFTSTLAIRNRWSRQCLTVDSIAQGAPVVQRPCDGSLAQKWDKVSFNDDGAGYDYFNLRNQWSRLVMNVSGGSGQYGAKIVQLPHVAMSPNAMFSYSTTEVID
jgi:Ricin-type beta-trefoil lectin domain